MKQITVDDLIKELDDARVVAVNNNQPTAMINATMCKAKLLGIESGGAVTQSEPQPITVTIQTVDARKYDDNKGAVC